MTASGEAIGSARFRYARYFDQGRDNWLDEEGLPELHRGDRRSNPGDFRSPSRRDRDRLLYSPCFQRLADVTQILHSTSATGLLHNRLTHSLKVAQLARSLAERFNDQYFIDPDSADAAGLAHDLGHPPYGHVGEDALDRLLKERGVIGYEGNGQAFRVATKLATHHPVEPGLNLTRVTLAAMLKYPGVMEHGGQRTKGVYPSEKSQLNFARDGQASEILTPEATAVDLADDISYALHDLDDFYRAGLVRISEFLEVSVDRLYDTVVERGAGSAVFAPAMDRHLWASAYADLCAFFASPENKPLLRAFDGTRLQQGLMRAVTSRLISRWLDSVERIGNGIVIEPYVGAEVTLLKEFVYQAVIAGRPATAILQRRERRRIEQLFESMDQWVRTDNWDRLPGKLRFSLEVGVDDAETGGSSEFDPVVYRAVADFISQLTESEASELEREMA